MTKRGAATSELYRLSVESDSNMTKGLAMEFYPSGSRASRSRVGGSRGACFNCDDYGHIARYCPVPKRSARLITVRSRRNCSVISQSL